MSDAIEKSDIVVIGGGAAGLMCALTAADRGRKVIILEGANKVGKKILMSGGGRCNFTNSYSESAHFLSSNPHFCKSALSRFTPSDFVALVEKHEIPYHEKALGQLFCDSSSKDVLSMLTSECSRVGVNILTLCDAIKVSYDDSFKVSFDHGCFESSSLVVATGGLSIPRMGASDLGYRLARQFGLAVGPTRAGLVPFTFTGKIHELTQRLSGVSCAVAVTANNTVFHEDILFTHRGLSGPAALQASNYWCPGDDIHIDFFPGRDAFRFVRAAKTSSPKSLMRTVLARELPRALVLELENLLWPAIKDQPIAQVPDDVLTEIAASLQCWTLTPAATEGFRTAEVTLGGISTDELSSKTMECKRQAGLYFVGEVIDVTGHLGGHNFQWAWSSGRAAGLVA